MDITIFGTGGVGSVIGGMLALAGHSVTFIARGEHLKTLQATGLTLVTAEKTHSIQGNFISESDAAPAADYLFLTVKSYDLPAVAALVPTLVKRDGLVIPVINGLPWWHVPGVLSLDPKGDLQKYIPLSQLAGGVAYMGASIVTPGTAKNLMPPKLLVGSPDHTTSPRLLELGRILEKAGFKRPITDNIQREIWQKLCWNIAFNPLSVLTSASAKAIVESETKHTAAQMMVETAAIANAVGIPLQLNVEDQLKIAITAGDHKPSMLQDFEQGKRLEVDAIIGAVCEIALQHKINTPMLNGILALLRLKIANRAL